MHLGTCSPCSQTRAAPHSEQEQEATSLSAERLTVQPLGGDVNKTAAGTIGGASSRSNGTHSRRLSNPCCRRQNVGLFQLLHGATRPKASFTASVGDRHYQMLFLGSMCHMVSCCGRGSLRPWDLPSHGMPFCAWQQFIGQRSFSYRSLSQQSDGEVESQPMQAMTMPIS